jgi:hypothetical protein
VSESSYKTHSIWSLVTNIKEFSKNEVFNEASFTENEQYVFARDKLFAITNLIHEYLENTPAIFVSIHGLNQLSSYLQQILNEINNFISNKNPAHIVTAENVIDQNVLPNLWSFMPCIYESGQNTISDTFENIRNASIKTIQILKQEEIFLTEKISTLTLEINTQQLKLENFSETIALQKAEAMAVTAQVQKEYAEDEVKRNNTFINIIDSFKESFSGEESEYKQKADNLINALETSKYEAAKIVQVVGNIGVTGNYQIIANNETKQANLWRWIAVVIFFLGIVVAIFTFEKFLEVPFTSENAWSALIRLLYAIAITTPAWYMAKESARHRSNADRARQTELELASLGPFIELMPEDKKLGIREELIKTYFGNNIASHEINEPIKIKLRFNS